MKDKKTRTQERIEKRNESYNDYVEQVTPKHSCLKNCAQAFVTGGIICTIGQAVMNMYMLWNDKDTAAAWTTLTLVLISVILTALNIYPSITKWGGAGSLVPITGFANSVAAPAIECFWSRLQNIYNSRSGYSVWNIAKLDAWNYLLDINFCRYNILTFYLLCATIGVWVYTI